MNASPWAKLYNSNNSNYNIIQFYVIIILTNLPCWKKIIIIIIDINTVVFYFIRVTKILFTLTVFVNCNCVSNIIINNYFSDRVQKYADCDIH